MLSTGRQTLSRIKLCDRHPEMGGSSVAATVSMLEMPDACEDHSDAMFVCGVNHFVILYGPSGLNDGTDTSGGGHVDAIPKRENASEARTQP
jgi:hypothetical protein